MAQQNGHHSDQQPPPYENYAFSKTIDSGDTYDSLLTQLDELESSVESLRTHASQLDEQKEELTKQITAISSVSNRKTMSAGHKEELIATIDRLMMRLLSVNIKVDIPRSQSQEEAYDKVKVLLDELQENISTGLKDSKKVLESYLNACSSEPGGPVDSKFQSVILSCTVDDQKQVRKCLNHWVSLYDDLHRLWLEESRNKKMKL